MTNATVFIGSEKGKWKINSLTTVSGSPIKPANYLQIVEGTSTVSPIDAYWTFKGLKSNLRYTTREEKNTLDKEPSVIGKPENSCAALILIKKSDEWWLLTQDERREIIEAQSHHIHIGTNYLPVISRQLYHSRDIGEPFDFITWFEFSPTNENHFNDLLQQLRATTEWNYVVREIDIRLVLP